GGDGDLEHGLRNLVATPGAADALGVAAEPVAEARTREAVPALHRHGDTAVVVGELHTRGLHNPAMEGALIVLRFVAVPAVIVRWLRVFATVELPPRQRQDERLAVVEAPQAQIVDNRWGLL